MSQGVAALTYAVRPLVIAKYIGQLAVMLAILSLAPLGAALLFGEYALAMRHAIVIVALLAVAAPTAGLPAPAQVQVNEALSVAALAFVLAALQATYPMMGAGLSFTDALFESVSAVTTTGLTTLASVEDKPRAFLFARAWMQWYGGLGIAVLSVALLMGHHIAARRLADTTRDESLVTTARTYARRILLVYAALTLLGVAVVWLSLHDGFAALTHVLSAISTGGFSVYDRSLAEITQWPGRFFIMALAFLGAIPLALYYKLYHGGWREFLQDAEIRALLTAVLIVSIALTLLIHAEGTWSWREAGNHAMLLGVSAQTTAGFTSTNIAQLDDGSKLVLILAMFIGGGVGSTAGGIKLLRVLILLRVAQLALRRTALSSHAVADARLGGRQLADDDLERVIMLLTLFAGLVVFSWLVFVVYGYPPLNGLFEVVSAVGTVGLSAGITNQELPSLLKAVLCADMLLGRVEILALLIVLYPRTWMGKRREIQ